MTLQRDPLTGVEVVIVGSRQARPLSASSAAASAAGGGDTGNSASTADGIDTTPPCPFCPGGLEAPDDYTVAHFTNRFPAMPGDRCEVVLYSPVHDASLGNLEPSGAEALVALWTERTATLGARDDVDYVLVFENRGSEVGATMSHPHGQIYAFDSVPESALRELAGPGPCALCEPPPTDLIVASSGTWKAWVPHTASWPYELRIAPGDHFGSLTDIASEMSANDGMKCLAAVLTDAVARLDRIFDSPMPYMMWIHQRPTDGIPWPLAHLHIHIAPVWRSPGVQRYVAAGELGSGVMFNPVEPAAAAAALRSA